MAMKHWVLALLWATMAEAEPITFHCYPPGAKVYLRGSVESYLGPANQPIEEPLAPGGFYEVVLRHPDGEHQEKIERPLPHQSDWPGTGQIVLAPNTLVVRLKDLVRYPTSTSYLLSGFVALLIGAVVYRLARTRRAEQAAHRAHQQAQQQAAAAEQARLQQEKAQQEAERRAEETRLAKVAQERDRQQLALRHQVLDQAQGNDPWIGLRVGAYIAVQFLGKGASSRVYEGQLVQPHPTAPPRVAIKVVETDEKQPPELQQRFMSEIDVGKSLQHPNIVGYLGATRLDKAICIFQELVSGGKTMKDLEAQGAMPLAEALVWLRPLAEALDYMHAKGIYHRDLKPANVMITPEGVPKIADLGLAKNPDHSMTKTYEGYGTPAYIAPEQITDFKSVDGRADQYALGCMAYQMLAGRLPFESGQENNLIMLQLTQDPSPIATLPEAVNAVLLRMLAKDRSQRFDTCQQAIDALAGRKQ
jgi:hypothetical protein